MGGIPEAISPARTTRAVRAIRPVLSIEGELLLPYLEEIVFLDVSLDELWAPLDIQAGVDASIDEDARDVDPRNAIEGLVPDFEFIFQRQKVGATVGDLHRPAFFSFMANEIEEGSIILFA